MGFPDHWLQVWWDLPVDTTFRSSAFLQWYNVDPWPPPSDFDQTLFDQFLCDIFSEAWGSFLVHPTLLYPVSGWYYWGPGSGLSESPFQSGFLGPWYNVGQFPTCFLNLRIRRITRFDPGTSQGVFRLCGIDPALVVDGHIDPAGLLAIQAAADSWTNPLVFGGVTFTPSVASYTTSEFLPITQHLAMPTPGIIRRRGRDHYPRLPVLRIPKAPPL
jgi:hypothetical protein